MRCPARMRDAELASQPGLLQLIIEVGVTALQPAEAASAPLLMALHRLNDSTRGEHGWIATIDDEERLLLSSTFSLAALDAAGQTVKARLAPDADLPAVGDGVGLQVLGEHTCFYKNEELVA